MAFGETSNADAAMAIIRLMRKIEALEKELEGVKAKTRNQELQRVVDRSKMPREGPRGLQGLPGERGPKGDTGPMPDHRWRGTALQFTRADGRWGLAVDLKGPAGAGGFVGGGSHIPSGGLTGQVLAKASDANRDLEWVNPATGSGSGDMTALTYDPAGKEEQVLTIGDLSGVANARTDYLFPAADPQIELAVNALGAKINELIAALT